MMEEESKEGRKEGRKDLKVCVKVERRDRLTQTHFQLEGKGGWV